MVFSTGLLLLIHKKALNLLLCLMTTISVCIGYIDEEFVELGQGK